MKKLLSKIFEWFYPTLQKGDLVEKPNGDRGEVTHIIKGEDGKIYYRVATHHSTGMISIPFERYQLTKIR